MEIKVQPLVSVLTPVYNGEKYLAECIESVLAQSYSNWDYTIVDNCSTDGTLEIAERYARMDKRICVHHYDEFVGVIENHNRAFRLITPENKYCKVVSADDILFHECLQRMVKLAEDNPSIGIVGSYQLSGSGDDWCVKYDKLPYPISVISGREICRWHLLGKGYVFGSPTSSLYRSDLVRSVDSFFPNPAPYGDTSACYKYLQNTDFGFVHQVLSYERIHEKMCSVECRNINGYAPAYLKDLLEYGPVYLTKDELEKRITEILSYYYKFLAVGFINFREKEFWKYHKTMLAELGYPFNRLRFVKAVCIKGIDLMLNPKQTIEKILKHMKAKKNGSDNFGLPPSKYSEAEAI